MSRVLLRLIRRAGPSPKPLELIERVLLRVESFSARAKLISFVGRSDEDLDIGTKADRVRMMTVLGRQVTWASPGSLRNERRLPELLDVAKQYGGATDEFFRRALEDDETLLRLLRGSISESFMVTAGDVFQRKEEKLRWKALEDLAGSKLLRDRILALASKAQNISDERTRVAVDLAVRYAQFPPESPSSQGSISDNIANESEARISNNDQKNGDEEIND